MNQEKVLQSFNRINWNLNEYPEKSEDIDNIRGVINSYFLNKNVSFEEVKTGVWYWYNRTKMWVCVTNKFTDTFGTKFIESEDFIIKYEENEFFANMVKDD